MKNNAILLDTHVWLWLINGDAKITEKNLTLINNAAINNNIFVAAISVWEIGMLESKNRIALNLPTYDWITAALNAPGITLAPLSPKIAIESCNLHDFHGDPADRMIVATPRAERLALITSVKKILQYSKKHQVDAIPAH